MGIKSVFLISFLLQNMEYMWIPEISVRTELLSYLSPGIIPDTLTNIFLNPAFGAKVTKNSVYLSHRKERWMYPYVPYGKSGIRNIVLTNFGFNIYMRTGSPLLIKEFIDLPEKKVGVVYGHKIAKQKLGIGYLYSYEEQDYFHYYGTPIDSQKIHSFSLGFILNELVNTVISFSKLSGKLSFSEINKTIINAGIGINGKVNNYFFITYNSLIDTSFRYNITAFNRVGGVLMNTHNAKVYTIAQLEYDYLYMPPHPLIEGLKIDKRVIFRLGIGFEQLLGNFSILGNFSQHIGRCIQDIGRSKHNSFTFFSDYPICLGFSIKAMPLKLWVRMSPYISYCDYWNIEILYILN